MLLACVSRLQEAVALMYSVKKVFLEVSQNSQEVAGGAACNFIKKETLAQVFSCEFCEISKNTLFTEHPRWLILYVSLK